MDFTINKESLEKYMNAVMSKIITKPGIYLNNLKKEYHLILQPVQTRELVEVCACYSSKFDKILSLWFLFYRCL